MELLVGSDGDCCRLLTSASARHTLATLPILTSSLSSARRRSLVRISFRRADSLPPVAVITYTHIHTYIHSWPGNERESLVDTDLTPSHRLKRATGSTEPASTLFKLHHTLPHLHLRVWYITNRLSSTSSTQRTINRSQSTFCAFSLVDDKEEVDGTLAQSRKLDPLARYHCNALRTGP